MGDPQDLPRDIEQGAAAEWRLEGLDRRLVAQPLVIPDGPVADQLAGGIERAPVVEQPDPERRQRAEPPPGPAIGAAHLDIALEPDFREQRRQMVLPVRHHRLLAGQGRQPAVEEVAERLAAGVDIAAVAVDEIHRHVEHVVDIALEPHAVLEHEGEDAAAVGVGVLPDMAAVGVVAAGLALDEGRIGEKRGGDRLEREADPHLADHVGLGLEIQIDLHRAGPDHHVEPERAPLGHVVAHDPVAALGHPGDLVAPGAGVEAEPDQPDAELARHLLHLGEMGMHLVAGLVDGFQRRARQFELPAGLQRYVAIRLGERDRVAVLQHRFPAETGQAFEQRADAPRALIGRRFEGFEMEDEFFVLGADPPVPGRLAARLQEFDQLAAVLDLRALA